jgi:DNA-binding XRE family transcriptional regulator
MPERQSIEPDEYGPRALRRLIRTIDHASDQPLAHQVELALVFYRDETRLTQQQLAERLGVKQPQVARLESGLVTPSIDTLMRISERLGIEFSVEIRPEGLAVRYKLPD